MCRCRVQRTFIISNIVYIAPRLCRFRISIPQSMWPLLTYPVSVDIQEYFPTQYKRCRFYGLPSPYSTRLTGTLFRLLSSFLHIYYIKISDPSYVLLFRHRRGYILLLRYFYLRQSGYLCRSRPQYEFLWRRFSFFGICISLTMYTFCGAVRV